MTNNYFRIRTDITKDQVVRARLTQNIDFLEILSLKISQEDAYKLHVSNYGVIVGRVLANDAFGIPNAKVSVFIPIDDDDKMRSEITTLYPYITSQTKDKENRRYNLLPDDSNDTCYRVVGSFPNKRLVLDNNTEIEIFEKYWKYTTVTNKSGDYMIFGVPTGNHEVHVDVDLSDIGVLSQKPRDFMYKGYSITQFDNSSQFKESTNLDNLSQLLSQNSAVHVYPFWGDSSVEEVAISRCDLQVQYKFEPTCVFFGSIVSDNFSNNIGDKCNPSKFVGFNRKLVAGEGTIEMIRKTQDGLIEEFQIQGNRLIDGNGVWCYQIPMNLDYVGTDEFGNIVPTDDPKKGIPTRTSVRFRVSMQETNSEGISRHRAKYLIPNVHEIVSSSDGVMISNPNKYDQCYEFGSATPDEFFRDLYWNKVYSVKNYIPRIQLGSSRTTQKYSAIRTVNESGNLNPFPFNHGRFRLVFSYRLLCLIMTIVLAILCALNWLVSFIAGICIPLGFTKFCPFKKLCGDTFCISVTGGLAEDSDENIEYYPCCKTKSCMKCKEPGCKRVTKYGTIMDKVQQSLAQEYDTVNLDFYNDWINGCLYFPLWFWKKTKKKKFLFGLFSKKAVNRYCNCDNNYKKLRITEGCSLHFDKDKYSVNDTDKGKKFHEMFPDEIINVGHGIVKEVENKNGLKIYYYSPGVPRTADFRDTTDTNVDYARLYSTDIILLGSLNDCDLDNLPRPFLNIPSTTANIPFISTLKDSATDSENSEDDEKGVVEITGMDWLGDINQGLLMDLTCVDINTKPKTCINIARMSELGVTLDTRYFDAISDGSTLKYDNERPSDGLITRYELVDNETRAMFASLNHNGLVEKVRNLNTGYDTYKLIYNYPTDFDGHLNKFAPSYTKKFKVKTYDNQNKPYVDYIFGLKGNNYKKHFYSNSSKGKQMPLFNNSFYFYFGLNEGNTAIDKFNNMFYSECFKNVKYPFTMTYTTTPAKWCKEYDNVNNRLLETDIQKATCLSTDYATIEVTLKDIKIPYSYTLYDEFNEEIMSESDMRSSVIKFGYNTSNGEYSDEKYGIFKKLSDGSIITYEYNGNTYAYLIDNGNYLLKVTDINGKSITQPISILQSSIIANATTTNLGDKYYDGTSTEDEFCGDSANYGEIVISSITIDGKSYPIISYTRDDSRNGYEVDCGNGNKVLLQIELVGSEFEGEDKTFEECACEQNNPSVVSGSLIFKIWVPGDYKITVTQICNGSPNDNTSSEIVTVENGSPFFAYIGDTPIKFMKTKFYKTPSSSNISDLSSWLSLHDEASYDFYPTNTVKDMELWKDFVDVEYMENDSGNIIDVSLDTKMEILQYKFDRLIEMSNTFYIFDEEDKSVSFDVSGGKTPILLRGAYPKYEGFSYETNTENKLSEIIYDSDAFVTCSHSAGNIVGDNYTQFDTNLNIPYRVSNDKVYINKLFSDSEKLGNYFAAFTQNAGYKLNENGDWVLDSSVKFLSEPQGSNPNVSGAEGIAPGGNFVVGGDKFPNYVTGNSSGSKSYFRTMTVDRRIDYSYVIILPYKENSNSNVQNDRWKNGRFLGYQINGLALAYDNQKNYIGTGVSGTTYEYYIQGLPTDDETFQQNSAWIGNSFENRSKITYSSYELTDNKRKLYSHTFKCGKTYDLNERFWALGEKDGDTTSIDDITFIGNKANTNSVFSYANYPIKRKIDMINFPQSIRYTYSAINCRYDEGFDFVVSNNNTYEYSAEVQEGDETTFTVGGNNLIQVIYDDYNSSVSKGYGNVIFSASTDGNFKASSIDAKFKIPNDTSNETHNNFIYLPYYVSFTESNNPYDKLLSTETTLSDSLDKFIDYALSTLTSLSGTQITSITSTATDFDKQVEQTTDSLNGDIFDGAGLKKLKRFVLKETKTPLFSDNDLMKGITFNFKVSSLSNKDFVSIFYLRRYLNSSMDNLSKDIMTFNNGRIFDIGNIKMSVVITKTEDSETGITTQTIDFTISLTDSKNKQISDFQNMTFKYYGNILEAKSITKSENEIKMNFDCGTRVLTTLPVPCEFFFKMQDDLIYKLTFKLNENGFA